MRTLAIAMVLAAGWPGGPSSSLSLSAKDTAAIHQVAKLAGIRQVGMMGVDPVHMPATCFVVTVQSIPVVDGNKRTWSELQAVPASRERSQFCYADSRSPYVSGGWTITDAGVRTREAWTIRQGSWHFDVFLGDVPYDTAARIVLALKNHSFVDRRTGKPAFNPFGDELLVGGPAYLSKNRDEFELTMGSGGGLAVTVKVTATAVELLSAGFWIS